jgi:hypothetical protein
MEFRKSTCICRKPIASNKGWSMECCVTKAFINWINIFPWTCKCCYVYREHDGATAHTTRNNLLYLQQFYGNRIIRICVPLNLPVCVLNPEFHLCSPDSTLLDFCIFRHLQNEVFKWRMHTLDELMEEITNCFNTTEQQMYNFALSTFSVKLGSTVDIEKT